MKRFKLLRNFLIVAIVPARQKVETKPWPQKADRDASPEFWRAFCHGSSIVSDCVCGRVNFANSESAGDWEDGELDGLRLNAEKSPDKYISHPYDGVSISVFGFIDGCLCGRAKQHEDFLNLHAEDILQYFKMVRDRDAADLERRDRHLAQVLP